MPVTISPHSPPRPQGPTATRQQDCNRGRPGWFRVVSRDDSSPDSRTISGIDQQDTFDSHRQKIADTNLPFGAAGNLQAKQNNHHDKGRGYPGHSLGKADIFEQVLYPDKRHHPKLRLIKALRQDIGVDIERADFIKQQEIPAGTSAA